MSDTHRTPDPAQPEEARTPQGEASPPPAEAKEKKPGAFGADVYTWLQALVVALTVLLLFFTFFGRVIGVDGHSMDPTLNDSDLLFLQCVGYEPEQGDVVVLHKDFGDITTPIVKRVIAVGGQTVDIDYESNTVYVDGVVLDEPYILEPMRELPSNFATHVVVPEGSIFVMGDNRNNSTDGRSPELGVVDERCVLGRALFVLLPFQDIGPVESISRPA